MDANKFIEDVNELDANLVEQSIGELYCDTMEEILELLNHIKASFKIYIYYGKTCKLYARNIIGYLTIQVSDHSADLEKVLADHRVLRLNTCYPDRMVFNPRIKILEITNPECDATLICKAFELAPAAKVSVFYNLCIPNLYQLSQLRDLIIMTPRDFRCEYEGINNFTRVALKQLAAVIVTLEQYPDLVNQLVHLFTKNG